MNVLHYSFSLSACPKCHLLICKHTSLANLDFHTDQQQHQDKQCSRTMISSQQHLSDGTNLYLFPSTISNNRYSWTTFGTNCNQSESTLNHPRTEEENIPFAEENIRNSSLLLTPTIDQSIDLPRPTIDLFHPTSFPSVKSLDYSSSHLRTSLFLILFFLLTNTIDIVLIYIYYHFHYIYLLAFLSMIILCDLIFWINHLIQSRTIPSYLLLIPLSIRFYLLYHLLEFLLIIIDRKKNPQIFHWLYQMKKPKLYQNLALFYLIHSGFFTLINLYFWSNNFQFLNDYSLTMDYFIPQWYNELPSSIHWELPSPSIYVLISILYYLIVNYSLLSTYLIFKRFACLVILSRLCLIIPRIYTFIFLFHFNTRWILMTFVLLHLSLIMTFLFDRSKFQHRKKTIFLQIIFSFITHQPIDDLPVNVLISLENISVLIYQLYSQILSLSDTQIILRLIVFMSVLISLQILGFLLDILSKYLFYRSRTVSKF